MKKIIIYTLLIVSILTGCGSATSNESTIEPLTQEEVNPEIVEYLDDFKVCADNYIKFLKKYYAMDSDAQLIAIGYLAEASNKYNKNCQIANDAYQKLDDADLMTDADKAYWMEVYTDCTMKVLEVLSDATESE